MNEMSATARDAVGLEAVGRRAHRVAGVVAVQSAMTPGLRAFVFLDVEDASS